MTHHCRPATPTPPDDDGRLLTMNEAAVLLNLGRSTLYYRAEHGQIPVIRVDNRPRIPAWWVADKLAADIADMQTRVARILGTDLRVAG